MQCKSFGSYEDALLGSSSSEAVGKACSDENKDLGGKKTIIFSYVEHGTREWVDHSVMGRRKVGLDVGVMQCQIREFGVDVHVHPIGESCC